MRLNFYVFINFANWVDLEIKFPWYKMKLFFYIVAVIIYLL